MRSILFVLNILGLVAVITTMFVITLRQMDVSNWIFGGLFILGVTFAALIQISWSRRLAQRSDRATPNSDSLSA